MLLNNPERKEVDHHTMRFIVGVMALSLAGITSYLSGGDITSISASYYADEWARNIFVGFLFAISAFLLAYNGETKIQMVLSKVAALAAIGVAMFPCECDGHLPIIPSVHGSSAGVMFFVLAFFCYTFYKSASDKKPIQAKVRAVIYAVCGIVIALSILVLAADHLFDKSISLKIARLTFYGEKAGLIAFGVAWLTASRTLPLITGKGERVSILPLSRGQLNEG